MCYFRLIAQYPCHCFCCLHRPVGVTLEVSIINESDPFASVASFPYPSFRMLRPDFISRNFLGHSSCLQIFHFRMVAQYSCHCFCFVHRPVAVTLEVLLQLLCCRVRVDQGSDVPLDCIGGVLREEIFLDHDAFCASTHLERRRDNSNFISQVRIQFITSKFY